MQTRKGAFLGLLIASSMAIIGMLPQVTRAMPPGSIRAWLYALNGARVRGMSIMFHDPADLTSRPGGQFEMLQYGQSPAAAGIHVYSTTSPVYSGQQVAVTSVIWFDESSPTPFVLTGPRADAHQMLQTTPSLVTDVSNHWALPRVREQHYPITWAAPQERSADEYLTGQTVNGRGGRPDVIESIVYTAPEVSNPSTYSTGASYYYSSDSAEPALIASAPEALILVNPRRQKVEVTGGPVAVEQLNSSAARLLPTDSRGQTVITASDITSCAGWVSGDIQSDCTANLTTVGLYTHISTRRAEAWTTLTKSMSKLAQERGVFTTLNSGAALSTAIKTFLEEPVNIWKASRGEVLYVTTLTDVVIDPGSDITINGKKILVFTNASSVKWNTNVRVPSGKERSPFYKFATIMFANGGTMELTGSTYNGAYISKGDVVLGGSGSRIDVNGLIMADTFRVTRAVDPATDSVIARITYDPSFQNGTVVGLSPFVTPLVSEGADR